MALSLRRVKVENDTFNMERKEGCETDVDKKKSCIGTSFYEYGKAFSCGEISNIASLNEIDGIHNTSGLTAESDLEAGVKIEEPCSSDDDVKPIVNQILDGRSLSGQDDKINNESDALIARHFEIDVKIEEPCSGDDVKPMVVNELDMISPSRQSDRLNIVSASLTVRDFGSKFKLENPWSDDDVKPVSLNQIQDVRSSSREDRGLNYNSIRPRSESDDHDILDDKEVFECQFYFEPVLEQTPISPDETMQESCLEKKFKKETQNPNELSAGADSIVIHSSVDHIVARSVDLENDIAGRPSWNGISLFKTDARESDSRSFPNDCPGDSESTVTKEILEREFVNDIDIAHFHLQSRQSGQDSGMNADNHLNNVAMCHSCNKTFSTSYISGHLEDVHTDQDKVKRYKGLSAYKNFVLSRHTDQQMGTHIGEKFLKCGECHKNCSEINHLDQHLRNHRGHNPLKHDQCHESFSQRRRLDDHIVHTGEKTFKCYECYKSFNNSSRLNRHKKTHTGEKPFKCDQCDKSFTQKWNLSLHMRIHTGEKPFKCDRCQKNFSQIGNLNDHMRINTGERPFKCDQCDKSFTHKWNLSVHMRIHTGEKPFKCDRCQKTFSHIGTLNDHMRIHTGERPFKCEQCQMNFNVRSSLSRHMRTHTEFKCDVCHRSFNGRRKLNLHMRTYTSEMPFECDQCQKSFSKCSDLK